MKERVQVVAPEQIMKLDVQEGGEFVVQGVIDLRGANAKLPADVLITFKKGGAIVNGTLTGNRTRINSKNEDIMGVKLKGTWQVDKISDLAFNKEYLTDAEIINNINIIQSDSLFNEVTINRNYIVTIPKSSGAGLKMSSNSQLYLNSTLTVAPNDFKSYNVIKIQGKQNVGIKGGRVVGDVGKHTYIAGSTSEWGMGIDIEESESVLIEGIYITHCTGDGIYISGGNEPRICVYDHACKNVTVKNVVCDDNRRQGMSIIHVDGLTISNSQFINTGNTALTKPGAGICFEPNVTNGRNMSIRNVEVNNCQIEGNKGESQLGLHKAFYNGAQCSFENIRFNNTNIGGVCYIAGDSEFRNCNIKSVTMCNRALPVHVSFTDCCIKDGDGVLVIINKPQTDYMPYGRNRRYSMVLNNCYISLRDDYNDKKMNALFHFQGKSDAYDGEIKVKNSKVFLPKSLAPDNCLIMEQISSHFIFERTQIEVAD